MLVRHIVLVFLSLTSGLAVAEISTWYQQGEAAVTTALAKAPNTQKAKNVILFLGDGMSITTITAARILEGQMQGLPGEEHQLYFETFPYTGLAKTYNTNMQTPDSAGTMTAIMTGVKTKAGYISVSEQSQRETCAESKYALTTFLEQAEQAGMATGVISTARITHATPAATYAHTPDRDWESDADIPAAAKKQGCLDIASQLLSFNAGDGIEVLMGGGRRNFLPKDNKDIKFAGNGVRKDGKNLIQQWLQQFNQAQYVSSSQQLASIDVNKTQRLLGLFNDSHMSYSLDKTAASEEPSLAEMTKKAIAMLSLQQQGYFLMVEGGRIDHGHHDNHAKHALTETIEFAAAIKKAYSMVSPEETLIIVTADHSHVMTMGGYNTRGNPILGLVTTTDDAGNPESAPEMAADGKPFTTLSYANGATAEIYEMGSKIKGGKSLILRQDLTQVDTTANNFHQPSMVPLEYGETHGGEDVAIYASGPWAHLFTGVHEQNFIYHVMRHAAQLDKR